MEKREELNKLVILFLNSDTQPTARQMYEKARETHILTKERITTFKSFVQVINSFDGVEAVGKQGKPATYVFKHRQI